MDSEDVIELGSSDDEVEPASKKMKPVPNAMVHIPRGVTIKPAKFNSLSLPKQLAGIGKNVTITNIGKGSRITNPYAIKNKLSLVNATPKSTLSYINKINPQVSINKLPKKAIPIKIINKSLKVHSPKTINNLPASITVTRTTGNIKRAGSLNVVNPVCKKQKFVTVELDDDDITPPINSGPQWYLRPEDQSATSLEDVNNKEPDKPNLIEITIEDSPVKPLTQNKQTLEVNAVIIDDSPIKISTENKVVSGSDNEDSSHRGVKVPHSKKKLEYPKADNGAPKTIEIEIAPITELNTAESIGKQEIKDVIEIEESPLKIEDQGATRKDLVNTQLKTAKLVENLHDDMRDFHPVYRNFIETCFELENSDDMKKIVEKKIKNYYRQVPKEYTESDEFINMVSDKILIMKAGPQKMYLFIKDIVEDLKFHRKLAKSALLDSITKKDSESNDFLYGEDSEYDSKRQRQIRKLEKTLKKLHRAIQKLETQEVDFDDDEDSVYLLTESDEGGTSNKDSGKRIEKDPKVLLQRYKERMVRVHAKFCQLTNTKMPSEPRVHIEARPGQHPGPARRLEKWINKKVPIGAPRPFPDFHDVLRCVREANDEDKIGWNDAVVMEEARDLFTRCGKKLQRRRQENEWRLAASRILPTDVDPAEQSRELKNKLDDNKKIASKKETEVFNKFADRQSQMKLVAEEIGDKEAEESPDESEDEEPMESSLENKEYRKERLKRLLHQKSKKTIDQTCDLEVKNSNNNEINDEMLVENVNQDINNSNISKELDTKKNHDEEPCSEKKVSEEIRSIDKKLTSETTKDVENTNVGSGKHDEKQNDENNIFGTEADAQNLISETPTTPNDDKVHSISDDSNKLDSDIDELHLLQKLHSGSEINTSTLESSDSDTQIAISDTLDSSSESNKQASDVISIENSTCSDSETIKETKDPDMEKDNLANTEIEWSNHGIQKFTTTNNDEYNEPIENILLASSDDEEPDALDSTQTCESINLKDDSISIGETVIEGAEKESQISESVSSKKQEDTNSIDRLCIDKTVTDPLDDIVIDNVQGSLKLSNILDKNEDSSSVDSVKCISTDTVVENEIVSKPEENFTKPQANDGPIDDDIVDLNNKKSESDSQVLRNESQSSEKNLSKDPMIDEK